MTAEDKKTPEEIVKEELERRKQNKIKDGLWPDVADMMIEFEHGKQGGRIVRNDKEK